MKIYDLSKELFEAAVFPGDPAPSKTVFFEISDTCPCNVTVLSMGSHNGTHMDAPKHFVAGAKDVAEMDLEKCVGPCKLVLHEGLLTAETAKRFLADGTKRLLIKGDIEITPEAAEVFAKDLRCGAALLCAALAAEGESLVHGSAYVERGYEKIEDAFSFLGGNILLQEEGA